MANLKFSQFQEQTDPANVEFVVGYNGTDNVRIDPANLGGGDFTQVYRASMFANTSSTSSYIYIPFTTTAESLTPNQDHAIVAAYDGYVSYIQLKNVATQTPNGDYAELDIAKDTGTGTSPVYTSLYSTGNISYTPAVRIEVDETLISTDASFSAGDILYFRYRSNGFWQRAVFNATIVYQP